MAPFAVLLLCTACTTPSGQLRGADLRSHRSAPTTPTTTSTTEPPLPVSPVQWAPCGNLQCGSVTVPLDYAHPEGATIQIALGRHPAEVPSERIGSIVINPGGPGGSGIDDLPNELSVLTPGLLDRFDIVSFDPRGVERSSPVTCSTGQGAGPVGRLIDPVPATPAAQLALLQNDQGFASACERLSGSILPYVGTVDTARDLDRIRAALGDAQLTFVGHSYGTLLGATYAQLFPTHVRAMVLDGAIDPALSATAYATQQAESFESELNSFFTWCAGNPSCPWRAAGDPTAGLLGLIQATRTRPLGAGSGTAGPGEIYDALLAGLGSQSSWPTLAGALADAAAGNGSEVTSMTDRYETGGSTNGADAEQAIDCLDHPVDRRPAAYPALAGAAAVGRTGVRSAAHLGTSRLRDVAGRGDPRPGTCVGPGRATDPGGGHDRRPGDPVLVGGRTGPRAHRRRAPHLAGPEPRRVLLQSLRPRRRRGLPGRWHPPRRGRHVHGLTRPTRSGARRSRR